MDLHISVSSHIPRKKKLTGNLQLLLNHFIGRKNGVASLLVPWPILNLALASAVPLALAPGTSLRRRLPTFRTLGRLVHQLLHGLRAKVVSPSLRQLFRLLVALVEELVHLRGGDRPPLAPVLGHHVLVDL